MNRKRMSLTLGLPAALAFGLGTAISGGADVDLKDVVAIVDIEAVHNGFPLAAQREQDFKALVEKFQAELKAIEDEIAAKQLEISNFVEGSDERAAAVIAVELAKARRELHGQFAEQSSNRTREEFFQEVSLELRQGIADYARDKGLTLVLRKRSPKPKARNQVDSDFAQDVIYATSELDITEQVIQFLQAAPKPDGK